MLREELAKDIQLADLPDTAARLAEIVGVDAALALIQAFGGDTIYIPIIDSVLVAARARMIREEYTGYNYDELARKYGCTPRRVRQIVEGAAIKPISGQVTLFDEGCDC